MKWIKKFFFERSISAIKNEQNSGHPEIFKKNQAPKGGDSENDEHEESESVMFGDAEFWDFHTHAFSILNPNAVFNAAACGRDSLLIYFLSKGKQFTRDPQGKTALMVAAASNHTGCMQIILEWQKACRNAELRVQ